MTQQTMTEKDMFLQTLGREVQITLKVLKAYPSDKSEYRPHEKSRSAQELCWNFVIEQGFANAALDGKIDFSQPMSPAPQTLAEVIPAYENSSRGLIDRVSKTAEADLNKTLAFPVGPGKMGDVRRMDVLWMTLMDMVHHRGQLSVYIRLAGGKVPSIYGPTADEPWV